jgi:ATP-dependent DNA ligase
VILFAFDLIELNGEDLRREPLEQRKAALAKLLSRAAPRIQLNEAEEDRGRRDSAPSVEPCRYHFLPILRQLHRCLLK